MIEFREAHFEDLRTVVQIHRQAFDSFFLTKLGPKFLLKYYRLVLEQSDGILIIAVNERDVVGFVAGFASPTRFYSEMKKRKFSFALVSIPALLRSPRIIKRLLLDFRYVRNNANSDPVQESRPGELSSIGVAQGWSGHGIGRGLLEAFIVRAKKLGLTAITLTTDADQNDAVNEFYRKAGFKLSRVFVQADQRRMNEYRLEHTSRSPA